MKSKTRIPNLPIRPTASAVIISALTLLPAQASTYGDDIAFLRKHTRIIELGQGDSKLAVAPAWQGRVMTSTAKGSTAHGFGWIGREAVKLGILPQDQRTGLNRHIHVFGGEERLWLGPEGGRFALFFPPGVKQEFEHWKTPALLDTEPFPIVSQTPLSVSFQRQAELTNRAGTTFLLTLSREIEWKNKTSIATLLETDVPENLNAVAYTTTNSLTNRGDQPWTRETGAPSIWLLGMFKPSSATTIVIPLVDSATKAVNTDYIGFGPIPENRARIAGTTLFFKGDGTSRGKLGVAPHASKAIAGSWQADTGVLTLVRFDPPDDPPKAKWPYVDSQWSDDLPPFAGDVINAYNDGPPEPGAKPLGPFYEIESSSPALFLKPGESHTHRQTTIHLQGPRDDIQTLTLATLGVSLDQIESALPNP
jgi:hypothetical protein